MSRIKLKAQEFARLAFFIVLCTAAASVGAQVELTWPVQSDLISSHSHNV